MIAAVPASAAKNAITTKGDTTIIVDENGDSTVITSKVAGLVEKIVSNELIKHLDDTVINNAEELGNLDNDTDEAENVNNFLEINRTWSLAAREMVASISMALVAIILIVLFFRYLNRRRKYKVMEKAIENHYELPEGVFGNSTKVVYNTPQYTAPTMGTPVGDPVQGTPVPPPFRSYETQGATAQQPEQGQQPATGQALPPMYNQISWRSLEGRGATAVGLGGMIFGLITGATPLTGIFCIPFFIGAFKMFSSYMDQRNAIVYAQYYAQQAPQQPAAPTQPAAPQQPAAPAAPAVPTQPVTEETPKQETENNGEIQM